MGTEFPKIVSVDDHVIEPPHLWQDRLPARLRSEGPRVLRSGIARMGSVGGVYSWEEDPQGTPCDFWLFEDLRYPMTRVMAAAGLPRDEVTVSPVTFGRCDRGATSPRPGWPIWTWPASKPRSTSRPSPASPDRPSPGSHNELGFACIPAYNAWWSKRCATPAWSPSASSFLRPGSGARRSPPQCRTGVHAIAFSEVSSYLGGGRPRQAGARIPVRHRARRRRSSVCTSAPAPECRRPRPTPHRRCGPGHLHQLHVVPVRLAVLRGSRAIPDLRIAYSEGQIGWIPYILERADHIWRATAPGAAWPISSTTGPRATCPSGLRLLLRRPIRLAEPGRHR